MRLVAKKEELVVDEEFSKEQLVVNYPKMKVGPLSKPIDSMKRAPTWMT